MTTRRFYVYVVELESPRGSRRPDVYVGSSALPPASRMVKHKTDSLSSRHVRRRGVRLLPHLYEHLNPLPSRAEAKRVEQRLRRTLEQRGHRVFGSCRPDLVHGCVKTF